MRCDK